MFQPGSRNLITDVSGIRVGHATDEAVRSGVTVLTWGAGWPAAVDVRGGGPGTRETDVLSPENLVGRAHALVLSGGSVFGLAAADGVTAELSAAGIGLTLSEGSLAIPIVPAAVLHDLANGGNKAWGVDPPYRALGIQALKAAASDFALGSIGAGRGAMAGLIKGGVGSASLDLGDGLTVAALAAVNPLGSVLMPDGRTYWAWALELNDEFGGSGPPSGPAFDVGNPAPEHTRLHGLSRMKPGANTTLGIVATNAALTTVECKRVAMMAHDGIARAVRPAHTSFDGDTVFAVSSDALPLKDNSGRHSQLSYIGSAAADCMARAIARGVYHAR